MPNNAFKKAVMYLGLADQGVEEPQQEKQRAAADNAAAETQALVEPQPRLGAVVTPLQRVTPTRVVKQQPMSEILTVHPRSYSEAPQIAENFRDGVPVILNLAQMNDSDARRIIDFAGGLVMGLNGHIERVTGKVFLLTPEHVAVSDIAEEEASQQDSGSFFVAPRQ